MVSLWCSGGESNPHALRHMPLKHACLPFHHPSIMQMRFLNYGKSAVNGLADYRLFFLFLLPLSLAKGGV